MTDIRREQTATTFKGWRGDLIRKRSEAIRLGALFEDAGRHDLADDCAAAAIALDIAIVKFGSLIRTIETDRTHVRSGEETPWDG